MEVSRLLAQMICERRFSDLGADEIAVAKHCLLDYLGVTIAGKDEPLVKILKEQILAEGGHPQASLVAGDKKVSLSQAALINGSAAHAHDYDDVHMSMSGHPTVPVAPALLALAEKEGKGGRELIQALVTGIDSECMLGRYVGASHYARGFHATATLGSFGAAAACANILELDLEKSMHALGIAATQAAGLKSMFGTMCKPFHAGKAAANGLMAVQLALGGFTSQLESLETSQGFGLTHSDSLSDENFAKALAQGNQVPMTLFKYHAACYLTHSAMEGTRHLLNKHKIEPDQVEEVLLKVDKGHFSVCNIQEPKTGLEAKFSLRFTAAMILHGLDTASISDFNNEVVSDSRLISTRDKVRVDAHESESRDMHISIRMKNGECYETGWNVAIPEKNLELQWQKLVAKFCSLSSPVIGEKRSNIIVDAISHLESETSLNHLWTAIRETS